MNAKSIADGLKRTDCPLKQYLNKRQTHLRFIKRLMHFTDSALTAFFLSRLNLIVPIRIT